MLKIISVSLLSLGLATGAMAQSSAGSIGNNSSESEKVNPGPMHPPQATDDTVTNSTRTNCAPNLQTSGAATSPDKTGSASTIAGEAGTDTNGQSSNC